MKLSYGKRDPLLVIPEEDRCSPNPGIPKTPKYTILETPITQYSKLQHSKDPKFQGFNN